jgi:hypothetical protein
MFGKQEPETMFQRLARRLRRPHRDTGRRRMWQRAARRAERNPRRGVR